MNGKLSRVETKRQDSGRSGSCYCSLPKFSSFKIKYMNIGLNVMPPCVVLFNVHKMLPLPISLEEKA